MSSSNVLELDVLLEVIFTTILTFCFVFALKKAVIKKIDNFLFLLILLVATFTSWLIAGHTVGFSMISIFVNMILGLIITVFYEMELAPAFSFTIFALGVIIWGFMSNEYYFLGLAFTIIGMGILFLLSRKK